MPKPPIEQCRNYILDTCLPLVRPHHREMLIPCLPQDYEDYRAAMELEEVKAAIAKLGISVKLHVVGIELSNPEEIIIAAYDDVANGRLDRYLQSKRRKPRGFGDSA